MCIGCIIAIFLIFAGFSVVDTISHWDEEGYDADKIYIDNFESRVINYTNEPDGDLQEDYTYFVCFELKNVSDSLIDSDVITYFYSGENILLSSETYDYSNNTTVILEKDDDFALPEGGFPVEVFFDTDNFTKVTHCVIVIVKDGDIVFNTTHQFYMHLENYDHIDFTDDLDYENDSNSSYKDIEINYIASDNSNIFHNPSCTYANKIKDENKIVFSNKEEALNAGYSPCNYCNP